MSRTLVDTLGLGEGKNSLDTQSFSRALRSSLQEILTIKGIVVPAVVPARLELKWCDVSSTPANAEYTDKYTILRFIRNCMLFCKQHPFLIPGDFSAREAEPQNPPSLHGLPEQCKCYVWCTFIYWHGREYGGPSHDDTVKELDGHPGMLYDGLSPQLQALTTLPRCFQLKQ